MKNFKIIFIIFLFFNLKSREIKIILDPQGDAQNSGRVVEDGFERNLTLEIAREIQSFFEYERSVKIILTRVSGESLEPLQTISFANRLNVDFYLNINVCQNNKLDDNKIFIYYHILNPVSDRWPKKFDDLALIKIDDIYLKNVSKNINLGNIFLSNFKNYTKNISINSPIGVPLKNLSGLTSPALSLELMVNSKSDIKDFIEPLCQALNKLIEQIA